MHIKWLHQKCLLFENCIIYQLTHLYRCINQMTKKKDFSVSEIKKNVCYILTTIQK